MKKTAYIKPELSVHQIQSLHLLSMSIDGNGDIKKVDIYEGGEYEEEELEII